MLSPMQYNPEVVQKLITRLGRRAIFVLLFWPLIGVVGGAYAGYEFFGDFHAVVGAIVGGYLGYLLGSMCSLRYKVQVQTLLWQKRIEELLRSR